MAPQSPEFVLMVTILILAAVHNLAFWRLIAATIELSGLLQVSAYAALAVALVAILSLALGLLAVGPLLRPVLGAALLLAAACSYHMDAFGVVIDHGMVVSTLETGAGEALDLITLPLLAWMVVTGLLPAAWVAMVPLQRRSWTSAAIRRGGLFLSLLVLLVVIALPQYRTLSFWGRENRQVRQLVNPTYPLYVLTKELRSRASQAHAQEPVRVIGADVLPVAGRPLPLEEQVLATKVC